MNGAYALVDAEGQYSPDPGDYWYLADSERFEGQALVKLSHPYHTTTGRIVYAPRVIKSDPTMRDLRRLARVLA